MKKSWRSALKSGDQAEIGKWIATSGLERVARIVAGLANASGQRGPPEKREIGLLLKMAILLKQQSERSLHSVALEVAREAHLARKQHIVFESLTSKLERDFRAQRHLWLHMATERMALEGGSAKEHVHRLPSSDEYRVLARLIELHPDGKIDVYDWILTEAEKVGPEEAKLVKRVGRKMVELLFEGEIQKLKAPPEYANTFRPTGPPRTFFEMIEAGLRRLQKERDRDSARVRRVGRKSAK